MKQRGINTVILVGLVLALAAGYYMWTHPTPQIDLTNARAESARLSILVDSLSQAQVLQDSSIVMYERLLKAKDAEIDGTNARIVEIKKYYENRIRNITSMSTAELDSFFTARYGQR